MIFGILQKIDSKTVPENCCETGLKYTLCIFYFVEYRKHLEIKGQFSLHVLHVFFSFRVGGSEVRTAQLINRLGPTYQHTIISLNGKMEAIDLVSKTANTRFIGAKDIGWGHSLKTLLAIRRKIKSIQPDLMICYGWASSSWIITNSFLKICPDICAVEGFGTEEAAGEFPIRKLLRKIFYTRCSAILSCSSTISNIAMKSWRVPPEKLFFIPNGIDTDLFVREPVPEENNKKRCVIGIVASLIQVKNPLLLLDAFNSLCADHDIELQIIGEGPLRGEIEEFITNHNLTNKIILAGYQRNPADFICKMDIFCLSSESEQMPMTVLEAMSCGLPVVSTNVGDVKEMVSEPNKRFIVKNKDVTVYREALQELILNKELRLLIGNENRSRCLSLYSINKMVAAHDKLYHLIAGKTSFPVADNALPAACIISVRK